MMPDHNYRPAQWEETILFFASAIGCTLGWTAVLSNLVYYTDTLGVDSYLILNVCIYFPLFPITCLQTLWDAEFDRQFGGMRSFWVRGSVAFAVTLLSTIVLAWGKEPTMWGVSFWSLLLGTASGILHGALKQMASFVYPGCGRLAAAVTAGLQASAVVVLAVTLCWSPSNNHHRTLQGFYATIAVLVALCWLGFQRLMTHSRDVYCSMLRRDSSIQLSAMLSGSDDEDEDDEEEEQQEATTEYHSAEDLLTPPTQAIITPFPTSNSDDDDNDGEEGEQMQPLLFTESSSSEEYTLCAAAADNNSPGYCQLLTPMTKELIQQSWPLCVAIFLTVASSMAVAAWFNRVPGSSWLPQVLFYTRLFADLVARPTTLWLPSWAGGGTKTLVYLLAVVAIRLVFVPYFFCYTLGKLPQSDLAMTLGVFAFAFSSGFITTWVYQLAPRYCGSSTTNNNDDHAVRLLQQTNLLNVCFSASILLGLAASWTLSGMKMASSGGSHNSTDIAF